MMEICENCLHYSACLINSEYVPSACTAYKDKTDVAPRAEVAREIFAEVRKIVTAIYNKHIFGSDLEDEEKEAVMDFEVDISSAFDELEEEYGITDNAPKE